MLLKQGERLIALDAEACNHTVSLPQYMITSKQLRRLAKEEKSEIYHVLVKMKKTNQATIRKIFLGRLRGIDRLIKQD